MNSVNLYSRLRDMFDAGKLDRYTRIDAYTIKSFFTPEELEQAKNNEPDYLESLAQSFTRALHAKRLDRISKAAEVLYDEVNIMGHGGEIYEGLQAHRYLMNELAWAILGAINLHARYDNGEFDGRIDPMMQRFITERWSEKKYGPHYDKEKGRVVSH